MNPNDENKKEDANRTNNQNNTSDSNHKNQTTGNYEDDEMEDEENTD